MKDELKPGGLAIIIKASHSSNLGKVVETIRQTNEKFIEHSDGFSHNPDGDLVWVIHCETGLEVEGQSGKIYYRKGAACHAYRLLPINPDGVEEEDEVFVNDVSPVDSMC